MQQESRITKLLKDARAHVAEPTRPTTPAYLSRQLSSRSTSRTILRRLSNIDGLGVGGDDQVATAGSPLNTPTGMVSNSPLFSGGSGSPGGGGFASSRPVVGKSHLGTVKNLGALTPPSVSLLGSQQQLLKPQDHNSSNKTSKSGEKKVSKRSESSGSSSSAGDHHHHHHHATTAVSSSHHHVEGDHDKGDQSQQQQPNVTEMLLNFASQINEVMSLLQDSNDAATEEQQQTAQEGGEKTEESDKNLLTTMEDQTKAVKFLLSLLDQTNLFVSALSARSETPPNEVLMALFGCLQYQPSPFALSVAKGEAAADSTSTATPPPPGGVTNGEVLLISEMRVPVRAGSILLRHLRTPPTAVLRVLHETCRIGHTLLLKEEQLVDPLIQLLLRLSTGIAPPTIGDSGNSNGDQASASASALASQPLRHTMGIIRCFANEASLTKPLVTLGLIPALGTVLVRVLEAQQGALSLASPPPKVQQQYTEPPEGNDDTSIVMVENTSFGALCDTLHFLLDALKCLAEEYSHLMMKEQENSCKQKQQLQHQQSSSSTTPSKGAITTNNAICGGGFIDLICTEVLEKFAAYSPKVSLSAGRLLAQLSCSNDCLAAMRGARSTITNSSSLEVVLKLLCSTIGQLENQSHATDDDDENDENVNAVIFSPPAVKSSGGEEKEEVQQQQHNRFANNKNHWLLLVSRLAYVVANYVDSCPGQLEVFSKRCLGGGSNSNGIGACSSSSSKMTTIMIAEFLQTIAQDAFALLVEVKKLQQQQQEDEEGNDNDDDDDYYYYEGYSSALLVAKQQRCSFLFELLSNLVRLCNNLTLSQDVGLFMVRHTQLTDVLIYVLGELDIEDAAAAPPSNSNSFFENNNTLVLHVLMCLSNLSYYFSVLSTHQEMYGEYLDCVLDGLGPLVLAILLHDHHDASNNNNNNNDTSQNEIENGNDDGDRHNNQKTYLEPMVEATRLLGNVSSFDQGRRWMEEKRLDEVCILLSASDDDRLRFNSLGVLVNLSADGNSRFYAATPGNDGNSNLLRSLDARLTAFPDAATTGGDDDEGDNHVSCPQEILQLVQHIRRNLSSVLCHSSK